MNNESQLRELFERIGKANPILSAQALIPALENFKNQVFEELAYAKPDPLVYAKIAGKAGIIEELLRRLKTDAEDGKAANDELNQLKGRH